MEYFLKSSEEHIKRERNKARVLRQSQWWRQKLGLGVCYYCEQKFSPDSLTMDHKIPIVRGGESKKGNVVTACKTCNNEKKYLTPVELVLDEKSS